MRKLSQLTSLTPITVNSTYPNGAIIDDTPGNPGTAVVGEIYNDPLVNLYKLLEVTGADANGDADNELNGYQLLAALQKLPNVLNDIEQLLSLTGTVFSIDMAIDLLPDKYLVIAKTTDAYNPAVAYTFKGTSSLSYGFISSNGFASGDEVLLILDQSGVRAIGLSGPGETTTSLNTPFGTPVAYNDNAKVWYQDQGILFSDAPETYDLQSALRASVSDGTLLIYEMLVIGNYVLCLSFKPSTFVYKFYTFLLSNLAAAPVAVTVSSPAFPSSPGSDFAPFVYYDGTHLWMTNAGGTTAVNYDLEKYTVNLAGAAITGVGSVALDSSFPKTTNAVIAGAYLYTYVAGAIKQYNLSTGAYKAGPTFTGYMGNIFVYQGNVFYTNGDVAKKWTLPVYS